ncbi:translocation protein sec66 [Ophiostoma piceae UAMH 11346]|uniref:Translocation protein sec66 n=1 Tax=Ophiostoma piceae (strain UAMH 11346) TaxID=1262450 RepID=S3C1H5_OPHP1|nr:translocation protein sec66 [Ophiostoma piceae UAMH 11346]
MVSLSFPEVDWASLILPFSYIGLVLGTFFVFARVYRKRKAQQSANLQPWFPPHLQRDVYLSLLHMEPEPGSEKPKKVPDSILRTALLRRAVEDINRIVKIRTAKQACQSLLERGSVGDELWQRFQRAEKEMEEELRDVVMEANALVPNWGQFIFQTANTIVNNEMIRKQLDATQAKADEEKAWAAQTAKLTPAPASNGDATSAPAALKEIAPAAASLDTPPAASAASSRPSTPLSVPAPSEATTPSSTQGTPSKKKKGKK